MIEITNAPEIEQAITANDFARALVLALAAWRGEPRSDIADLIDVLTSRLASSQSSRLLPARAAKPEYQKGWMALAKKVDPTTLPSLLDGLTRSVPEKNTSFLRRNYMRSRLAAYLARVEALARFPKDPRIATRLLDVLRASPWSVMERRDADDAYGSTITLIGEIGDERSIAGLEDLLARPTAKRAAIRELYAASLPRIVTLLKSSLPRKPRDRSPTIASWIEKLGGAPTTSAKTKAASGKARQNEDALLAMVLANPDDREARQVYADALLDRGDPRGELMAIQLKDKQKQTRDDEKRVRSIQRKHDAEWLGDLARVTKLRIYREGMLDEAELLQAAVADDDTWARVATDERLATLRTLHKGVANEALYRQLVLSPTMRALQSVTVPSRDMLAAICASKRPLPFTHLIIERPMSGTAKVLVQLDDTKALPKLQCITIAVEPDRVAPVLSQLVLLKRRFERIIFDRYRGWWSFTNFPSAEKRARLAAYNRAALQRQAQSLSPTQVTLPGAVRR